MWLFHLQLIHLMTPDYHRPTYCNKGLHVASLFAIDPVDCLLYPNPHPLHCNNIIGLVVASLFYSLNETGITTHN